MTQNKKGGTCPHCRRPLVGESPVEASSCCRGEPLSEKLRGEAGFFFTGKRILSVAVILVALAVLVVGVFSFLNRPRVGVLEQGLDPGGPVADQAVVVTDQLGRKVQVASAPQKIVSLSPSNTEVAFALGLGERIVGVTEHCNYPPAAMKKEIIGGFSTPSIERVVELDPDLVLASTIHTEELPRFEELGIPVLVIESSTLDELFASIVLVAELTGVTGAGEALVGSMRSQVEKVQSAVGSIAEDKRILVYYEVYSDPLMSAGSGAFINEIITLAGGVNIFRDLDEDYPQISAEVVVERQPEIILFPDYHGTADLVLEMMVDRPGWENVPAVSESRVYAISDDTFARPGPRMVEAVEEAARLFYPNLF